MLSKKSCYKFYQMKILRMAKRSRLGILGLQKNGIASETQEYRFPAVNREKK